MFRGFADFLGGNYGEDGAAGMGLQGTFRQQYRCYSVAMFGGTYREDVDNGGKIIMPPSALDQLSRRNIVYPMLFKMSNHRVNRDSHVGVLEFVAEEGKIHVPQWVMRNLSIREGDMIWLEYTTLESATFAKFKPQSVDFLEITNPKALLERSLRSFACLTKGDTIAISYNKKLYEFCVEEVTPGTAVSIIECDMKVDFSPPVGYKVPETPESMDESDAYPFPGEVANSDRVFQGEGRRLDGKSKNLVAPDSTNDKPRQRGVPNYSYKKGKLSFMKAKDISRLFNKLEELEGDKFEAFGGKGETLRVKKKRT